MGFLGRVGEVVGATYSRKDNTATTRDGLRAAEEITRSMALLIKIAARAAWVDSTELYLIYVLVAWALICIAGSDSHLRLHSAR